MQRLNATIDKVEKVQFYKGLMYVRCSFNGNLVMSLVDSKATHNFIWKETAKRFGLCLSSSDSMMKCVNVKVSGSHGVDRDAMLRVDS